MKKRKLALVAIFALSAVMLFSGCESKQKKMQKAEETIKQTLTEKYNKDFEIIDLSTYDGGLGTGDTANYEDFSAETYSTMERSVPIHVITASTECNNQSID